jgi:hypothetical protein
MARIRDLEKEGAAREARLVDFAVDRERTRELELRIAALAAERDQWRRSATGVQRCVTQIPVNNDYACCLMQYRK